MKSSQNMGEVGIQDPLKITATWMDAGTDRDRERVPGVQGNGETVETVADFIYLFIFGSKITADGDFSHEIKRHLLLGRKVMTNLDSILKSRDITLPTRSI